MASFIELHISLAQVGDKKNYIYDGDMSEEAIMAYITKVKAGEVEPHLKSEPVPAEPQEDPVKVVVGKNLQTKVIALYS